LGFGNGVLAVIDTSKEASLSIKPPKYITDFSGASDRPIDKMRVVYLGQQQPAAAGGDKAPANDKAPEETLLLSLSNSAIRCHPLPRLEPQRDVLDIDEVLDFEVYRSGSSKSSRISS